MRKLLCVGLAVFSLLSASATVSARDDYPSRPVQLINGFPAGGLLDTISRILGDKMGMLLGQAFIIESRPGAGGTLASARFAKTEPDGYTLMIVNDNHAINAHVYKNLSYDSLNDFSPIGFIGQVPMILAVNPAVQARNVSQLIELARKTPNDVTYASIGAGSASHLAGEMLAEVGQAKLLHVPYRGGAPALTDLLAGHIKAMFLSPVIGLQNIQENRLTALAVTSEQRLPQLPDVPTMKEAGYPLEAVYWFGLVAPAKTPQPILSKLEKALGTVLAMPEVQERLLKLGVVVMPKDSQDFWRYMKAEIERWGPIVQNANVRP